MTLVKVDGTTHQTWLKSPRFLPFRSAKNPADYATEKDDLAQTGNDQNQTGLCRSNTFNSGFQTSQQHSGVFRSSFHLEPIPLSIRLSPSTDTVRSLTVLNISVGRLHSCSSAVMMWWMSVECHMHIHNAAYINGTGVGRGAAVPEYRLPPYGTFWICWIVMAMPIADGIMFFSQAEYKKPREATDSYSIGLDCHILTPECFSLEEEKSWPTMQCN